MYPTEQIDDFSQELSDLIADNWEWAYGCVEPRSVEKEALEGFIPYTDGGVQVWIKTNFQKCQLPITAETRLFHEKRALEAFHESCIEDEDEETYVEKYLKGTALYIKFVCFYLNPKGNGGKYENKVAEETIICQAYLSFDEYGRDNNYDSVGYGYSSDMTSKGLEKTILLSDFDPTAIAQELFQFICDRPSEPLFPQKI